MKTKFFYIIAVACLCFSCTNNPSKKVELEANLATNSEVEMLAGGKLRYLELSGTPYERGLTHGKLLKKDIEAVIKLFKEDIANTTQLDPDQFIEKFLSKTDYITAVETLLPDAMEEIKGISDGSGIDFNTIFMHQLGDEYWFNTQDILAHNCSSFGVDKNDSLPSITAQNMDIPQFYYGFQTLLKIKDQDSDKEMMFLTIPGHLGITGMNNRSVSINCNTLMQLDYGKTGLPVTFVVRGVVGKSNQEEALAFVNEVQHASGQNYIIGGPEKVFSLECSANKVSESRPFASAGFTYHTNHPMSNTDYSDRYLRQLSKNNKTPEEGLYQCQRIKSFERRFTENTTVIDVEEIKEVLRSRDHNGRDVVSNDYTYASVIYQLSDPPSFIIAPGKPHEEEYIELDF